MTTTTATATKTIKRNAIQPLIEGVKKGSFVGLNYSTRCGRTVGGRKIVEKNTDTVVVVGKSYKDFVDNVLERQGDDSRSFVPQEKRGFEMIDGTDRFIRATKTGKVAIKYIVAKNAKPQTTFYYNGDIITKDSRPELFQPSELKPKVNTLGRGSVKVDEKGQFAKFQNLYISNIVRLTVSGTIYIVID